MTGKQHERMYKLAKVFAPPSDGDDDKDSADDTKYLARIYYRAGYRQAAEDAEVMLKALARISKISNGTWNNIADVAIEQWQHPE